MTHDVSTRFRRLAAFAAVIVASGAQIGSSASSVSAAAACSRIAHIGDSTTTMMSDWLGPAYAANGWKGAIISAGGGRAITQALPGDSTGLDAVNQVRAAGFRGCWVIALGTNDTANSLAFGGTIEQQDARRRAAIDSIMASIGLTDSVLWVNVHLVASTGYYTADAARSWNSALRAAAMRYPNLVVYDWDAVATANPSWLSSDTIHYTSAGNKNRATLIAGAATMAFTSSGSVVQTDVTVAVATPDPERAATFAMMIAAARDKRPESCVVSCRW
jgi:hypothetical protein